ncbi:MAG: GNAT family N-acetyltransferase [Victivallales bacterium]
MENDSGKLAPDSGTVPGISSHAITGKLAGSAVSCCYDGKHAVISKVIVEKSCRRRGFAMNLMQRVMASYPCVTSFCWIPRRTG